MFGSFEIIFLVANPFRFNSLHDQHNNPLLKAVSMMSNHDLARSPPLKKESAAADDDDSDSNDGESSSSGLDLEPPKRKEPLSPEMRRRVELVFIAYLDYLCDRVDATTSSGELIHQPLMATKTERLDQSGAFRPFRFRIHAFTSGLGEWIYEDLRRSGDGGGVSLRQVREFIWDSKLVARYNTEGKKVTTRRSQIALRADAQPRFQSKSKGNHQGSTTKGQGAEQLKVDLFELLPVPFGLARFGVAPDHPEVKNCEHKFEETARDPRFRFFGNVQVGGTSSSSTSTLVPNLSPAPLATQIPLSSLTPYYDAILLTYGASLDRPLSIPGEEHNNVLSARSFVNWYNGHPAHSSLLSPLIDFSKTSHVTVVGQGNVALDVARLLLKPVDELKATDLPEYALAELARSKVKHVEVVGRRGPLQLAATTKELREMINLPDVAFAIDPDILSSAQRIVETNTKMEGARAKKRALGLLAGGSKTPLLGATKSWSLEFLKSPVEILPSVQSLVPTTATGVRYELNELIESEGGDPGLARARGTGTFEERRTDLVFKSVGYRSIGLPGLPFDERKGIVRNVGGKVVDEDGEPVPKLYTSGWLSRGPTGVIATTMFDAFTTADLIASDLATSPSSPRSTTQDPPIEKLAGGGGRVVSWKDWERIDDEEKRRGRELGKVREKMTDVKEMLEFLK
ncbi:NADPH-adrenodoxin reductase Arh1 [Pseudohyphozyma bogoriensis]|nr:NADPH-adrenodoxin reductase Arh1 [Pseudohyphozyma bogoriensis]